LASSALLCLLRTIHAYMYLIQKDTPTKWQLPTYLIAVGR
jgi:hypothetical protein